MFWYKLHLFGDVYLSTGPEAVAEGELIGTWEQTLANVSELARPWRGPCGRGKLKATPRSLPVSFRPEESLLVHSCVQASAACSRHCSTLLASCRWMPARCGPALHRLKPLSCAQSHSATRPVC